jgi:hypothetical protein
MADGILDRLDRDPGGAREYVATLLVVGGASRAEIAQAMARKYGIPAPTGRSVTKWKNNDPELRALIEKMEAAKLDLKPGDDPAALLRREANPAQAVSDLLGVCVTFPAFGLLLNRERTRQAAAVASQEVGAFEQHDSPPPSDDPDDDGDVFAVLAAEHETAAEFEADCVRRLGDYDAATPTPGAGALSGYEPLGGD